VTCGGAPAYVWPGGGITVMVDVTLACRENAFGYVPTPALVAPIEFTLRLDDYAALGGHMDHVQPICRSARPMACGGQDAAAWRRHPHDAGTFRWPRGPAGMSQRQQAPAYLPDGAGCICSTGPST
jgi:hypothetical protein